ncbi:unnamed protein product [Discosporangium mesarthrocarpum]
MMRGLAVLFAVCSPCAHAFVVTSFKAPSGSGTSRPHACGVITMGGAQGVASTKAGKIETVKNVGELLENTNFLFAIPSAGIKANEVVRLRKGLPENSTAKVVKNKLMRIAAKGTKFEKVTEMTTGTNCWIFVEGEDMKTPVTFIQDLTKDIDKANTLPILYGIYDGEALDEKGVVAVSKLPSRQELYQRLAVSIQSVPTNLGRRIKMVPTKVGRVIKMALVEDTPAEEGKAPAE